MAIPRVFISSTFYDLRHVRNDLEEFVKGLGYEPVMHDKGKVAYAQGSETLEESCYTELSTCDIVVCIIGNKFGTESSDGNYSITMHELQTAMKENKIIYVFIQKDVFIENGTYIANKDTGSFKPAFVDDIRVHEFILEIKNNIKNYPTQPFDSISELIGFLRLQFAGLFQRLLSQQAAQTDSKTYYDIKEVSDTIRLLVAELSDEKGEFFRKLEGTIYSTNAVIREIAKKMGLNKATFFAKDRDALEEFIQAMGFVETEASPFDVVYKRVDGRFSLTISEDIFDEQDNIKDIRNHDRISKMIQYKELERTNFLDTDIYNGDLPF